MLSGAGCVIHYISICNHQSHPTFTHPPFQPTHCWPLGLLAHCLPRWTTPCHRRRPGGSPDSDGPDAKLNNRGRFTNALARSSVLWCLLSSIVVLEAAIVVVLLDTVAPRLASRVTRTLGIPHWHCQDSHRNSLVVRWLRRHRCGRSGWWWLVVALVVAVLGHVALCAWIVSFFGFPQTHGCKCSHVSLVCCDVLAGGIATLNAKACTACISAWWGSALHCQAKLPESSECRCLCR